MNLVINKICRIALMLSLLPMVSIGCLDAKPLSTIPIESNAYKDVKLVFYTIYDSDTKCDQNNYGFTWQDIENDLKSYGLGRDKIHWLMSPYLCTQIKTQEFSNAIIYELYDKNSPLYVFYIHEIDGNKRLIATVTRNDYQQNISEGKREYFGDLNTFNKGKFTLDQYIDQQDY